MSKSKRKVEAFTNKFGQVIETDNKVACITQGYSHSVRSYVGTYVGYVERETYRKTEKFAQVEAKGHWDDYLKIRTLINNFIFKLE